MQHRIIVARDRILAALENPIRGRSTLILILAAYVAAWTVYAVVAKATQGINHDLGEIVAWSWDLQWGTPKHPPFLPTLVRFWFSIFPVQEWAFYMLATTSTAVAIYFAWLISGRWLDGAKRAAVPFFLMLVPFYNFIALKFDHNAILIPLWAVTTYAFIRSFESRGVWWSVLAGVCAGLAIMTKYWSVFLFLGLASAALCHSERTRYLKSPPPWIITAVSFGMFAPHLFWMVGHNYETLTFIDHRAARSWIQLVSSVGHYASESVAYVIVPLVLLAVLALPGKPAMIDMLWPADRERRFAATMFWIPLLAPIPLAIGADTRLASLWTMSGLSLFAVMLLSSPLVRFDRRSLATVATVAALLTGGSLLASPIVAIAKLINGKPAEVYTRQLAKELDRQWKATTSEPLQIVAGKTPLVNSVSFHLGTQTLPIGFYEANPHPWDTPDTLDRSGAAIICPADDNACLKRINQIEAGWAAAQRTEVEIRPHWLMFSAPPRNFVIAIVPPLPDDDAVTAGSLCCISAVRRTKSSRESHPAERHDD